jgi:hypothetical protein
MINITTIQAETERAVAVVGHEFVSSCIDGANEHGWCEGRLVALLERAVSLGRNINAHCAGAAAGFVGRLMDREMSISEAMVIMAQYAEGGQEPVVVDDEPVFEEITDEEMAQIWADVEAVIAEAEAVEPVVEITQRPEAGVRMARCEVRQDDADPNRGTVWVPASKCTHMLSWRVSSWFGAEPVVMVWGCPCRDHEIHGDDCLHMRAAREAVLEAHRRGHNRAVVRMVRTSRRRRVDR